MVRSKYTFHKREREKAQQQKQKEKMARRMEAKQQKPGEEPLMTENETVAPMEEDSTQSSQDAE